MKRRLTLSKRLYTAAPPPDPVLHAEQNRLMRQIVRDAISAMEDTGVSSTLCFTGHRIIRQRDKTWLPGRMDAVLEACYRKGYTRYLCGGAIGFDTLAAEAVLRLQSRHDTVRLVLVLPCSDQSARWTEAQCQHYERLLYRANEVLVLSDAYYDGCMLSRNRYMVAQSSLCISYLYVRKGGTASAVSYAIHAGVPVLNVTVEQECAAFLSDRR